MFSIVTKAITFKNVSIGLIRVSHSEVKVFHEEDIDSLRVMATHLGLVIENNGLKNFLDSVNVAMESLPQRIIKNL